MYDAALREFFQDSFTQSMFTTAHDSQIPVYIQPLAPGVVSDELITTITARVVDYARSYDVAHTPTDNPGQLVFSFSAPEVQPDSYTFTCKTGPTIFLSLAIRGQEETTWQSRGYLMTKTANNWQADLYVSGI